LTPSTVKNVVVEKYIFKENDMPLKKFSEFLQDDEDEPPRTDTATSAA
jgi:hypothetical protein